MSQKKPFNHEIKPITPEAQRFNDMAWVRREIGGLKMIVYMTLGLSLVALAGVVAIGVWG